MLLLVGFIFGCAFLGLVATRLADGRATIAILTAATGMALLYLISPRLM